MKKSIVFYSICMLLIGTNIFADIYKCVSDDGATTYSDQPCGNETELVFDQPATSVNEALRVKIDPFLQPYTEDTYDEYITGQVKRISRSIFPEKWFHSSEIVRVYGPSPRDSHSSPKPEPIYGTIPGRVIFLHYGPQEDSPKWTVQFQYLSQVRRDINGVPQSVMRLKSISIKEDGLPFTPKTMNDVTELNLTETGEWVAPL